MKEYKVNLSLSLTDLKLIFSEYEVQLMDGETIYFSGRLMLSNIFKQLSSEDRILIEVNCPRVVELLKRTMNVEF